MSTTISNSWWDSYRNTVKVTKLFRELVSLANGREDVAQNMVNSAKQQYPGKSEIWCLNKLIAELQQNSQNSIISVAY